MKPGVQTVWWVGLIGGLAAVPVVLKEVSLIVRALRDIHDLAQRTGRASNGIAENGAAIPRLSGLEEPARALGQAASNLSSAAGSLERKLGRFTSGSSRSGG